MFQRITMNLIGAHTRKETFEGKEYTVVPCVMLTHGVHNGSEGPLYYPPEELAKDPVVWNTKPVVVYHPTLNGEGVSACDPLILESQKAGMLFSTNYDGRLRTEVWLDEPKLNKVDPRVMNDLNDGKMVEVSTGLFHDLEATPGVHNGKAYKGIVRNIKPDHLAILPDEKGACSVADGAGLLRNQTAGGELSYSDIRDQAQAALRSLSKEKDSEVCSYCYVCDVFPKYIIYEGDGVSEYKKVSYKVKDGKVVLGNDHECVMRLTSYVTTNGESKEAKGQRAYMTTNGRLLVNDILGPDVSTSDMMLKQKVGFSLKEKYAGTMPNGDWGGWVVDVFANYAIYSHDGKLFRLPYTYKDDKVSLDGEPEEVDRVTEYKKRNKIADDGTASSVSLNKEKDMADQRPPAVNAIHKGAHELVAAATSGPGSPEAPAGKGDGEARTKAIAGMVAAGKIDAGMSAWFEKISDELFGSIYSSVMKGVDTIIQPYSYEGIKDRSNVHNRGKPVTVNEYVAEAPPEIRDMLADGLKTRDQERTKLVKVITANKQNRFTEDWLKGQPTDALRGMAALAQQRQPSPYGPDYSGQGAPQILTNEGGEYEDEADTAGLVVNAGGKDEDVLALPVMDWK